MPNDDHTKQAIRLLWGEEPRRTRGPRPKLSVEQIARAAIDIATRDGIEAVSMQRVAGELGYTTMSLYNYVSSKNVLIEVMMDVATEDPPELTGETWRERTRQWMSGLWDLYMSKPWMARVTLSSPPIGPRQLAWFDQLIQALNDSGLRPGDQMATATFLLGTIRGLAKLSLDVADAPGHTPYDETLTQVLTDGRFPALAAIASPEVFGADLEAANVDEPLQFGLERLLDGIDDYVRSMKK